MEKNKDKVRARNQKVAKLRGSSWRDKLMEGRLRASMNPTQIRIQRLKMKKTQKEMAESLGVSLPTYGSIESGIRHADQERMKAISTILKLSTKAWKKVEKGYMAQ